MKTTSLTIRLDRDLDKLLSRVSRKSGKSRREVAREALRLVQFEALRKKAMPFAEAKGYLTDEDVFSEVS